MGDVGFDILPPLHPISGKPVRSPDGIGRIDLLRRGKGDRMGRRVEKGPILIPGIASRNAPFQAEPGRRLVFKNKARNVLDRIAQGNERFPYLGDPLGAVKTRRVGAEGELVAQSRRPPRIPVDLIRQADPVIHPARQAAAQKITVPRKLVSKLRPAPRPAGDHRKGAGGAGADIIGPAFRRNEMIVVRSAEGQRRDDLHLFRFDSFLPNDGA